MPALIALREFGFNFRDKGARRQPYGDISAQFRRDLCGDHLIKKLTDDLRNGDRHIRPYQIIRVHSVSPAIERSAYPARETKTPSLRGKNLPPTHLRVELVIGSMIRNRSVQFVATATGRAIETVKKWRQTSIPDAWTALIGLMAADDEVFYAVLDMAGRSHPTALTHQQREAVIAALKIIEGRK